MIQLVLSVRDIKAEAFGRPIFVAALGAGLRSFSDEVNRDAPDNELFKHAPDFDLFELGTFDDSSGLFTLHPQPKLIGNASVFKDSV